ncbi:MAG: hypothetical protein ACREBE_17010 [bacterium]
MLALTVLVAGLVLPWPRRSAGTFVVAPALPASDSVDVRIALAGEGATEVRAGQAVHLISYADVSAPRMARVDEVGTANVASHELPTGLEARVRLPRNGVWRRGVRGEARIELGRSTLGRVLWSTLRQGLRVDLGL